MSIKKNKSNVQTIVDSVLRFSDGLVATISSEEYLEVCESLEDAFSGRADGARTDIENQKDK